VQVIVCDQRMPAMSGTEFLSKVKEMYPDTIRIILSGYTGLEAVLDSINRGAIYRFYTKPWDDTQLRDNVRLAFHHYWLMHGRSGRRVGEPGEDVTALIRPTREVIEAFELAAPAAAAGVDQAQARFGLDAPTRVTGVARCRRPPDGAARCAAGAVKHSS
jgi:DNA-binding NtrC family response regulator